MKKLTLLLFILFWTRGFVALASKDECKSCVESGCTYCKGDSFFDESSACVCESLNDGFFGGCDDFSFGSTPLNSKLDCTFNTHLSGLIVALIAVVSAICLCGCCFMARAYSMGSSNNPTSATSTMSAQGITGSPIPFQEKPAGTVGASATT